MSTIDWVAEGVPETNLGNMAEQPAQRQEPVWEALPYTKTSELYATLQKEAFVLHYHGKQYRVERAQCREHYVYVQPPGMPVKIKPDGSSGEGHKPGEAIWLQRVSPPASKQLTDEQRKAIVVCFTSGKVSVSEVQRKLAISYNEAQQLCQSIVDLGLAEGLQLAPSLNRHGIKGDA